MKDTMTIRQFANAMNVTYWEVRSWISRGFIDAIVRDDKGHWQIPRSALNMEKPKKYARSVNKGIVKYDDLRAELTEVNIRYSNLLVAHAGLQGKYDQLQREFEHAKGFAQLQENDIEDFEKEIEELKKENEELRSAQKGKAWQIREREKKSRSTQSTD